MKKNVFLVLALATMTFLKANAQFNFEDVQFWVGSGSKKAILVVDFNDGTSPQSFAWGYQFDGFPTAEKMIHDIDSVDESLEIIGSGYISDVFYGSHLLVSGDPLYWGSFNGNGYFWTPNLGVSETLSDSLWFGLSLTEFDAVTYEPLTMPENPVAALNPNSIINVESSAIMVWPNPAQDFLFIGNHERIDFVSLQSIDGKSIAKFDAAERIDISFLPAGLYMLRIIGADATCQSMLILVQR